MSISVSPERVTCAGHGDDGPVQCLGQRVELSFVFVLLQSVGQTSEYQHPHTVLQEIKTLLYSFQFKMVSSVSVLHRRSLDSCLIVILNNINSLNQSVRIKLKHHIELKTCDCSSMSSPGF